MPPVRSAGIMPPGSCRHVALLLASSSACRRVAQQLGGCRHLSCCSAVEHMPPPCMYLNTLGNTPRTSIPQKGSASASWGEDSCLYYFAMRGSCRLFALRGSIKPPFCYAARIMPRLFCYAGLTAPFCLSSGAHAVILLCILLCEAHAATLFVLRSSCRHYFALRCSRRHYLALRGFLLLLFIAMLLCVAHHAAMSATTRGSHRHFVLRCSCRQFALLRGSCRHSALRGPCGHLTLRCSSAA